jgi:ribosome recycling factor
MPTISEIKKDTERRMHTSIEALRTELKHLRTGRASVSLLEGIMVEYYGTPTPLSQVANLSAPDATLLLAQPWEPSLCPAIEKAIRTSDLGLNPASDGRIIRIPVPSPTEERRKEIVKKAHALLEHTKVELRHHRHESNEKVKKEAKASTISADEEKRTLDEIQKLTDKAVGDVDAILKAKETEILAR